VVMLAFYVRMLYLVDELNTMFYVTAQSLIFNDDR
jgi:hypothetical protein